MGKHKKFLRSEKAKVKLKGNKLPKGQNITKTDFRVKKIIIKDQKFYTNSIDDNKDSTNQKQDNLKDLVIKLKHHNVASRMDALRILKEKISNGIDNIHLCYGLIIQGLSSLCLDLNKDIRNELYKILIILFTKYSECNYIESFIDIILSYLNCAMTHIQKPVQDDSLLLFDILIKYQSKLIAKNYEKIFSIFLDMISKVTITGERTGTGISTTGTGSVGTKSLSIQNKRLLTINIGNKMSTIKWRSRILQRLKELIKIKKQLLSEQFLDSHKMKKQEYYITTLQSLSSSSSSSSLSPTQHYYPLIRKNSYSDHNFIKKFLNKSVTDKNNDKMQSNNDDEKLKMYVNQLMPLLFDSWLECIPISMVTNDDTITSDTAITLKYIIEIIVYLWELIELQTIKYSRTNTNNNDDTLLVGWFCKNFNGNFQKIIFTRFPYQQAENFLDFKKKHNNIDKNRCNKEYINSGGQYCLLQNFMIIYLYCVLSSSLTYDKKNRNNNAKDFNRIYDYLQVALTKYRNFSIDEINYVEKILRIILLSKNVCSFLDNQKRNEYLFKKILSILNTNPNNTDPSYNKEFNNKMLPLVSDIVLENSLSKIYDSNELNAWIEKFPIKMLFKNHITKNNIMILLKLAKQGNQIFLNALKYRTNDIISNLFNIQVHGYDSDQQNEGRKSVLNLFYWINDWSESEKQNAYNHAQMCIKDSEMLNYFHFVINKR